MNKNPKISIIIPVYNAEKYMRECLNSVVNQTYENIEILCINDGSSDNSLNILEEYGQKDKRIKIFSQKNSGPAKARNVGLENAKGEYLWFIDADDWIELGACEELYNIITKKKQVDYIHFGASIFDESKKSKVDDNYYNLTNVQDKFLNQEINILNEENITQLYNLPSELWSKCFRRQFVVENEIIFNDKFRNGDDALFSSIAFIKAKCRVCCRKNLYNYRIFVENSICNIMRKKNCDFYLYPLYIGKYILQAIKDVNLNKNLYKCFIKKEIWRIFKTFNIIDNHNKHKYYNEIKKYIKTMDCDFYTKENLIYSGYYKELKRIKKYNYLIYVLKTKINNLKLLKKHNKKIITQSVNHTESINQVIRKEVGNINDVIYLHTQVFPKYKNINYSKKVVLVATGPTLSYYTPINNAVHVGVNRAYEFDKVPLDYIFLCDYNGAKKYIKNVNEYNKNICRKFYGLYQNVESYYRMTIPESDVIEADAERFIVNGIDENFYYNIETRPFPPFHSTVFPAAMFALYTAPKELYLVGCDCTPDKYFNDVRVWNNNEEKENHQRKIFEGWERFKYFASIYYPETKIISINPIGLKGLFSDVYTKEYIDEYSDVIGKNEVNVMENFND